MPIVSIATADPFVDGRQSERALSVRTGVERHLTEMGWATLPELTLKTGRRADLVGLSTNGDIVIVEVKSSIADLRADTKWPEYRDYCDTLFFATLADVPADIFPEEAGLIIADSYGADLIRKAPEHRISAARRKAVILRFARATAQRLARCCEHAGLESGQLAGNEEML